MPAKSIHPASADCTLTSGIIVCIMKRQRKKQGVDKQQEKQRPHTPKKHCAMTVRGTGGCGMKKHPNGDSPVTEQTNPKQAFWPAGLAGPNAPDIIAQKTN